MEPDEVIYLVRLALALAVGYISGAVLDHWLYALITGIAAYAMTIPLTILLYGGAGYISRRAVITSGMAAYVFVWLTVWILVYNLLLG